MRFSWLSIDKTTAIAGMMWVVVGLGLFAIFNPGADLGSGLLADIAPSTSYVGEIGVKVTNKKIQVFSNVDLKWIKELVVTITKLPDVSILTDNENTQMSLLSPEMTKYSITLSELKKWKKIEEWQHNAQSTRDITIGDIQAVTDSPDNPEYIPLSVTNLK